MVRLQLMNVEHGKNAVVLVWIDEDACATLEQAALPVGDRFRTYLFKIPSMLQCLLQMVTATRKTEQEYLFPKVVRPSNLTNRQPNVLIVSLSPVTFVSLGFVQVC